MDREEKLGKLNPLPQNLSSILVSLVFGTLSKTEVMLSENNSVIITGYNYLYCKLFIILNLELFAQIVTHNRTYKFSSSYKK